MKMCIAYVTAHIIAPLPGAEDFIKPLMNELGVQAISVAAMRVDRCAAPL